MAHPSTNDPDFERAVTEVLEKRLAEVREHYAAVLDEAGFVVAATFLRNYRENAAGEEADRG